MSNLLYRPDGRRISFSTHLFLFISLMFGVAFVLPPEVFDTSSSPLYRFTSKNGLHFWWGVGLVLTSVTNAVMVWTRSKLLVPYVGMAGFCLWVFAAFAYLFMGFTFGLLVAALPNALFWGWYSIEVSRLASRRGLDKTL